MYKATTNLSTSSWEASVGFHLTAQNPLQCAHHCLAHQVRTNMEEANII